MILAINPGSSSLKYQLFDNGLNEKLSGEGHIKNVLKILSQEQVEKIVYRIVHGGALHKPIILNEKNIKRIENYNDFAPLHNPIAIKIIKQLKKVTEKKKVKIKHIGIFDTAFHHTIPEKNYTYAIPYSLSKKYGLRKYGFHGISHEYLSEQSRKILGKNKGKKLITVHLGSGSSITAVLNGKSIDNSLGFSPNEGLVMATRSGDIDPGIIWYLNKKLKYSNTKIDEILNHKSGLLGISGKTSRMEKLINSKNKRDKLAVEVFVNHIVQTIGSYITQLNGVDGIVFSGGIGESEYKIRKKIIDQLSLFGMELDADKNKNFDRNKNNYELINSKKSKSIIVMHTDEGYMMAKKAKKIK